MILGIGQREWRWVAWAAITCWWASAELGLPAVGQAWPRVTGEPLPSNVRDYLITRHNDDEPGDET